MPPERRRWLVLAAGLLANMCQGAAYTVSVFREPMSKRLSDYDPSLTDDGLKFAISVAVSLSLAFLPVGMLLAGRMADRGFGRWTVAAGALLFGAGLFAAGNAATPWTLWLTYGMMTSLGSGMAYGTIVGATVRWFPDRRGLAAGMAVAALGAGSMVIAPAAAALVAQWDVVVMFRVLGAAAFALMGLAAWFVRNPPDGWTPAGWTAPAAPAAVAAGAVPASGEAVVAAPPPAATWRDMLRSGRFYRLWSLYFCGAFGGLLLIPQCKGLVLGQHGAERTAVLAVMLLGAANAGGRLFWGWVSDRTGRWRAMGLLLAAMAVGMAGLALSTSVPDPMGWGKGHLVALDGRTPEETVRDLERNAPVVVIDYKELDDINPPAGQEMQDLETGAITRTEAAAAPVPGLGVQVVGDTRWVRPPARVPVLVLSIMLVGLCFGGVLGLFPSLCAEAFGTAHAAVNYGVLFTAFSAAALVAPQVGDRLPFAGALAVVGGLVAIGLLLAAMSAKEARCRR